MAPDDVASTEAFLVGGAASRWGDRIEGSVALSFAASTAPSVQLNQVGGRGLLGHRAARYPGPLASGLKRASKRKAERPIAVRRVL